MPNLTQLLKIQKQLASKIILKDEFKRIKYIGGADVSFDDRFAYGCIVVMDMSSLSIIDCAFAKRKIAINYIPTFLSFREQPVICAAYKKLKIKADILLCDGQGIAHPRRAGLACALGVVLNIPTIGVAKTKLCGKFKTVNSTKNSYQYLYYRNQKVGIVLRTQTNVKPIFISPGHKISLQSAKEIVRRCVTSYRIPEPLRLADIYSKIFKREKQTLNPVIS
ncbi:MAG: deoxyribonuclease V [candidate division WOR-3 bacterium]